MRIYSVRDSAAPDARYDNVFACSTWCAGAASQRRGDEIEGVRVLTVVDYSHDPVGCDGCGTHDPLTPGRCKR